MSTITLPVEEVRRLCETNRDLVEHLKAVDKSATASMYGVEYADKAWARVAAQLPGKDDPKAYRIQAEAVGGTKAEALAYLIRIAAALVEDPNERGHTCGGADGNASARIEAIR